MASIVLAGAGIRHARRARYARPDMTRVTADPAALAAHVRVPFIPRPMMPPRLQCDGLADDAPCMGITGQVSGNTVAMAAFRDRHFQGYAVRTRDGWMCVAAMGMSWSKLPCRTAEDARMTLRTASHANRFDHFTEIDQLIAAINALQPFEQPGILPEQIAGMPQRLPKLRA